MWRAIRYAIREFFAPVTELWRRWRKPMTTRQAILAAADNLEWGGGRVSFMQGMIPGSADSKACPLAWIGFYLGLSPSSGHTRVAAMLGSSTNGFYDELSRLLGGSYFDWTLWYSDEQSCAKALRLYADKHFPETGGPK